MYCLTSLLRHNCIAYYQEARVPAGPKNWPASDVVCAPNSLKISSIAAEVPPAKDVSAILVPFIVSVPAPLITIVSARLNIFWPQSSVNVVFTLPSIPNIAVTVLYQ